MEAGWEAEAAAGGDQNEARVPRPGLGQAGRIPMPQGQASGSDGAASCLRGAGSCGGLVEETILGSKRHRVGHGATMKNAWLDS